MRNRTSPDRVDIMKILLAADGSRFTTKAVDYLVAHFNWFKEAPQLHVLHVKAPIPDGRVRAMLGHDTLETYYREESEKVLKPIEERLRVQGVACQCHYAVGDIAEQVRACIARHAIDLVVMGSHGHSAIGNLFLGSSATRVVASVSVPVLLIR